MKKRSKKIFRSTAVFGLDPKERDLFLRSFFTGEIEKEQKVLEPKTAEQKSEEKPSDDEISDDERALFLQAANEIIIGRERATNAKTSPRSLSSRKRKVLNAFLDLHGMIAEDALRALLEFIKREKIKGSKTLLVVHGKGAGILRNVVWAVLESHPAVNDFQVAPGRFGGDGALIVRINRKMRL